MKSKVRKSVPHYTYRQSANQSEKIVYKRIKIVLLATVVLGAIIWFWGTSFINLLGILAKPAEEPDTTSTLNIPISKPVIDPLPEYTNNKNINVSGTTTAGEEITLEGPADTLNTVSNSDGEFNFEKVALKEGLNLIKVYVIDSAGERLEESFVVTYDNKKPDLEIIQPKDGETFSSRTQSVEVVGRTEPDATVFVNDLQAIVNPDGQFTFGYPAKKGTQTLDIKSTDEAGNTTEELVTIIIS